MWQCLPVTKDIVRIAHFSFLIALITCSPSAVRAQSNVGLNTIVDVKEDRGRGSAVITTAVKKPLPRPIIQFLQGENGNTVLVADFNDVVFPGSTKVINVDAAPLAASATTGSAGPGGIKLVRIGRYQESPPIFRVAIVSSDAEKLKNVNFVSGPGSLVVKWPKTSVAPPAQARSSGMPQMAPAARAPIAHRRAYQTNFNPSPAAGALDPSLAEIPQVSQGRIDPEVASSNYMDLRPAMAEPTIETQQHRGLKVLKPTQDEARPVELSAKQNTFTQSAPAARAVQAPLPYATRSGDERSAKTPAFATERKPAAAVEKVPGAAADRMPPTAPLRVAMNKPVPQTASSKPVVIGTPAATGPKYPASNKTVSANPVKAPLDTRSNKQVVEEPPATENGGGGGAVANFFSKFKEKAKNLLASENDMSDEDLKEAPKVRKIPANIDDVSQKKKEDTPPPVETPQTDDSSKNGTDSQSSPIETREPPTVSLIQNSNKGYTIKIVSADKSDLNFSSFRLHNPERFVIDLQNQRELSSAVVPQPESFEHLKAVRVGAPDPLKNTGRLVLDLSAENVSVIPGDASSVNEVSFVVGEAVDPVAGLTPPPGSVLVLDAGHGGTDPGAQRGFVKEKDLTLAIAQKTREKLAQSGIKVIMTRADDTFVTLQDRVAITNTTKPDMFLSVHINSLESTKDIHGIETYYQTDMSRALAQNIHESLVKELDAPDRNIRKAKFYVVNRAEVPAVLAEVGFISNKAERDKLVSEDYQEKIAGALTKGAILYLKQHSAVAGKVSRASDSNNDNDAPSKEEGSTIPRAKSLVHKGLGIKSN
jgi:N-acetylmuramoyl-L-alanine amidase CwlD